MPFPQSPVPSSLFLAHITLHLAYAVFWCYIVGFDAFSCIWLTSPSLIKGVFKHVSLLPGKSCSDANQRIGLQGGIWGKVGVFEIAGKPPVLCDHTFQIKPYLLLLTPSVFNILK